MGANLTQIQAVQANMQRDFSQILLSSIWTCAIGITAGLVAALSWLTAILIGFVILRYKVGKVSFDDDSQSSLSLLEISIISLWGIAPCLVWLSQNPHRFTVSVVMLACGFLIILGQYKGVKRPAFIVATPYALLCTWQLYNTFGSSEFAYIAMAVALLFGTFITMVVFSLRSQKALDAVAQQRAELIAELKKAKDKAEASDQFKSRFLANMSHEIRTPLNGIVGLSEVLKSEDIAPRQLHFAETINSCGLTLLDLVNDILDLSKIEAGGLEIVPKPFNLRDALKPLYVLWRQQAADKGLGFKLRLAKSVPETLIADFPRLKQCLTNLVGNAVKFTDEGDVVVLIRSVGGAGGPGLQIDVSDKGIGIAHDKLDDIFQPFKQSDPSISTTFGGTGLGLTITSRLCDLMGGSIGVQSEVGQGTTFTMYIPASTAIEAILAEPTKTILTTEPRSRSKIGGKVLIVDDVALNIEVLKTILAMWSIEVHSATTGMQAISMANQTQYDVIFMDIRMPEMDGVSTMRHIRALNDHCRKMPIIAISANAMRHETQSYLKAGMTDFASKPITVPVISHIVETYLDMGSREADAA